MKYQDWKIKKEHNILKEFTKFLEKIEKIPEIKRIIPWRIDRQQKSTSDINVSYMYPTTSWLKYKMKKWATVQELFIICDSKDNEVVVEQILRIIKEVL